jgi:uncharacterized protein
MGELEMGLFRLPGYVGGEPGQPVPRDVVAVVMPVSEPAPGAHWSVDFRVDDVDRATATATAQGGSVLAGPYDAPPFRQAVLADPNGVAFSVSALNLAG